MKINYLLFFVALTFGYGCAKAPTNQVTIKGVVTNAINDKAAFIGSDTTYSTVLDDKGAFEVTFSLDTATYLSFSHGTETTRMFVYPGDQITLAIDPTEFDETISYQGSATSSYLANKFMLRENSDLLGAAFYGSNTNEYAAVMDQYKQALSASMSSITDSNFTAQELAETNEMIGSYIKYHDGIADYSQQVRTYIMNKRDLQQSDRFNFFFSVDSLSQEEFSAVLAQYADTLKDLLSNVTDTAYLLKEASSVDNTVAVWADRKLAVDNKPKTGEQAADFSYPDINGNELSLSSFKGGLVYVDVWATWCGPCKAEIPSLKQLEADYHDKNITFMSVSVDEDKEAWQNMVKQKQLGGVQLLANGWSKIAKDYAIFGIPNFMLFAADGSVITTNAPRPSSEDIRPLLDANL